MDVTPQVINEVEFHQKMRGYDPDEVDDFLERVAVAFEQLQERIRSAEQRAAAVEKHAAEGPRAAAAPGPTGPSEAETTETIQRTLVLAQRTADAAIKDAQDEARRIIEAVQEQAQRQQAEAQEQARKLVVDAEAEARKSGDETRQRLIKEIITLEETRDALRADHGILERHLDEQRLRLRSSIGDLQRLLDDPARLRAASAPEVSGATRPDFVDESLEEAVTADGEVGADAAPADAEPDVVIDLDASEPVASDAALDDDVMDDVESEPKGGGVTFTPAEEINGPAQPLAARRGATLVSDDTTEDEAWARFTQGDVDRPTMPVTTVDASDDAYLSELRKAMLEDTSASTLDPGEHRARTRFGRRR
jgi:DivIVA domain-containing protein